MNARLRIRDCRVRRDCLPLLVAITLLVSACVGSDTPQARFDDYLTRLARTLDVERPAAADTTARLYPARRELLLPVQQPRTGWIGFFELRRCALANLVAERNSILGRVAPPHVRLAYESRLLAGLKRCRASYEDTPTAANGDNTDFIARLDQLIAVKQDTLGAILWNRTWASPAMTHLFSIATGDAGLEPSARGRASRSALTRLTHALRTIRNEGVVTEQSLVEAYETLDTATYGGQIQNAALRAASALDQASALLSRRLARRPLCFDGRPNRRARVLRTILLDIYGQRVQPYLADLVRAGRLWRETTATLVAVQTVALPGAFRRYHQATLAGNTGVWARLDAAIAAHTETWQTALRQCSLMPGADAGV